MQRGRQWERATLLPTLLMTTYSEQTQGLVFLLFAISPSFWHEQNAFSLCLSSPSFRDSIMMVTGEPSHSSEQKELKLGSGVHVFLTHLFSLNIELFFYFFFQPEMNPFSREKPKPHPVLAQLCRRGHWQGGKCLRALGNTRVPANVLCRRC